MTHILIGKIIVGMQIASDNKALRFILDGGQLLIAECDADCCSETWVEHVELPALGFPCAVISAGDIDMHDLGGMAGCDFVSYYGFKIVTDKGEILIDYRNDSNGYYGGSLIWPTERHYGGVFWQNNSAFDWIAIDP